MADANISTNDLSIESRRKLYEQHNVKVVKGRWAKFYTGTKQSLIRANIIKDGQFPSDEGNNKVSLRIVIHENGDQEVIRGKIQLRKSHIIRVVKVGEKFTVEIPYSEKELERKSEIDKYEKALKEENQRLASLANDKDQARSKHLTFMQSVHNAFIDILESGIDGYHYDKAVIDEYKGYCHDIWELLNTAKITLHANERENIELEIKAKKLSIDTGFSSFMDKLSKPTKDMKD